MLFEVELRFKRPPCLGLRISAPSAAVAKQMAKEEARRGGFGEAKKVIIFEVKE
jgi:hypothetical protein